MVPDVSVFPFPAAVVALRVCGAETKGLGLRVGVGQLEEPGLNLCTCGQPCPTPTPPWRLPHRSRWEAGRGAGCVASQRHCSVPEVGAGRECGGVSGGTSLPVGPKIWLLAPFGKELFNEAHWRRPAPTLPRKPLPSAGCRTVRASLIARLLVSSV